MLKCRDRNLLRNYNIIIILKTQEGKGWQLIILLPENFTIILMNSQFLVRMLSYLQNVPFSDCPWGHTYTTWHASLSVHLGGLSSLSCKHSLQMFRKTHLENLKTKSTLWNFKQTLVILTEFSCHDLIMSLRSWYFLKILSWA